MAPQGPGQYCIKINSCRFGNMPRHIGSVWVYKYLCNHSHFHKEAAFVAARQLGLGPQISGLCCAVNWLSVPKWCCAQERVEIHLTAEVAVVESKSAFSPAHKELKAFTQTKGGQSGDDMSWETVVLSCYRRDLLDRKEWRCTGNLLPQVHLDKYIWSCLVWAPWNRPEKEGWGEDVSHGHRS